MKISYYPVTVSREIGVEADGNLVRVSREIGSEARVTIDTRTFLNLLTREERVP